MSVLHRFNVRCLGSGPTTLVFAHGFGCDQGVWRAVVPVLAESHRTVQFDLAGYGQAEPGSYDFERHATLAGHAADLVAVCRALALERPVVVAHSVSAMSAVLAAGTHPGFFGGLVLLAPSPSYIDDGDYVGGFQREDIEELLQTLDSNYFAWSRMMAPVVMGNPDRPALGDDLGASFCRADPVIARHFARVTFLTDSRAALKAVVEPTLILQCQEDVLAPLAVGDYVHRAIGSSRIEVLQATGHCPHLSAPAETAAAIARFVTSIGRPASVAEPA